jgi:hypothetical protein
VDWSDEGDDSANPYCELTADQASRLPKRTRMATHINAPEMIPAAPSPATALPTIKTGDERASAHTREPTSRNTREHRKIILGEKTV